MRSDFSANFITAVAQLRQKPVTLLEFAFATGTVYLSDFDITVSGQAYSGKVTSWGKGISQSDMVSMFGPMGREWEIEVENTGASPFSANFGSNIPENTVVTAYHWFRGLTSSDKAEMGRFYIGPVDYDETRCRMKLISPMQKADKPLGLVINRTDFPDASWGTIGKSLGYVYGSVNNVPLLPLKVGWQSALVEDIDATTTGIVYFRTDGEAGKVTDLPTSGTIIIGDEEIPYSSRVYNAPSGPTDTHNNYVVVSSRGTNARPYQQGTVAIEQLSDGYVYGFPYHFCKAARNLKANGIPLSSGFTWDLTDITTLSGAELATVNFSTHPRRIKSVMSHSHIDRRHINRSGSTGNVSFVNGGTTFTSTANVPDSATLGTAQNGYIDVTCHLASFAFAGGHTGVNVKITFSGGHIATQIMYLDYIAAGAGTIPPPMTVRIPLTNIDWSSDIFSLSIKPDSLFAGSTGVLSIDKVEWYIEYTGGDAVTKEVKDRIEVAAPGGQWSFAFAGTNKTVTATVPTLIGTPQEIYIKLRIRVDNYTYSAAGTHTGWTIFAFSGAHLTTQTIISKVYPSRASGTVSDPSDVIEVLLKVNSPDLSADCFSITVNGKVGVNGDQASAEIDEAVWIVEYPLGNVEVLPAMEIISDGPQITADIDGVYFQSVLAIDDCDNVNNWTSSDDTNFVLSQSTSIKTQGTGSLKIVAATSVLVQNLTGTSSQNLRNTTATTRVAQRNIPLATGYNPVTTVDIRIKRVANPTGSVWLELYSTKDDDETTALLATSGTITGSAIPTSYSWITFSFYQGITLSDGKVWLVVRADNTIDATNYYQIEYSNSDVYGGTDSCFGTYGAGPLYTMNTAYDMKFKINYEPARDDTATISFSPVKDFTLGDRIELRARSNRTGTYLAIRFGESAVDENTLSFRINSPNTWELKSIIIDPSPCVPNGTFENDLSGWGAVGATLAITRDTSITDAGSAGSLKCVNSAPGWVYAVHNLDPYYLTPGLKIDISGRLNVPTGSGAGDNVFMRTWFYSDNYTTVIATVDSATYGNAGTGGWIDVTTSTTVPAGTVTAQTSVHMHSDFTVYWDNVEITNDAYRNEVSVFDILCTEASSGFTLYIDDILCTLNPDIKTNPGDILQDIVETRCGLTADSTAFDAAITSMTSAGYSWGGLVRDYPLMSDTIIKLLPQCRCFLWHDRGKVYLKYFPDTPTSTQTIDRAEIFQGIKLINGPLEEIINSIDILYNINWRNGRWQGHHYKTDATSITKYGTRNRTIPCDFVQDATMAGNLRDFYIAQYKDRKKIVALRVLFDNINIEQFDEFKITHDATAIGLTASTVFRLIMPPAYTPGGVSFEPVKNVLPGFIGLLAKEA